MFNITESYQLSVYSFFDTGDAAEAAIRRRLRFGEDISRIRGLVTGSSSGHNEWDDA